MPSSAAQASSEPTGGGCSLVRVRLSNTGHLPTYGSLQSMTAKAVRDQALAQIELAVRLPTGAPFASFIPPPRNACRRCCAPLPKRSKPSLPIPIECYAFVFCCHSTNVPLASIASITAPCSHNKTSMLATGGPIDRWRRRRDHQAAAAPHGPRRAARSLPAVPGLEVRGLGG